MFAIEIESKGGTHIRLAATYQTRLAADYDAAMIAAATGSAARVRFIG